MPGFTDFNKFQAYESGRPVSGGKLFSFLHGTSTPAPTYQDADLTVQNAHPIILDAEGRCNFFLNESLTYDLVLQRADGSQVWRNDEVRVPGADRLARAGGTMTGPIVLHADATQPLNPVTLQQLTAVQTSLTNESTARAAADSTLAAAVNAASTAASAAQATANAAQTTANTANSRHGYVNGREFYSTDISTSGTSGQKDVTIPGFSATDQCVARVRNMSYVGVNWAIINLQVFPLGSSQVRIFWTSNTSLGAGTVTAALDVFKTSTNPTDI